MPTAQSGNEVELYCQFKCSVMPTQFLSSRVPFIPMWLKKIFNLIFRIDNYSNYDILWIIKGRDFMVDNNIQNDGLKQAFDKVCEMLTRLSRAKNVDNSTIAKFENLFAKHPELVAYQNKYGQNLGMIAGTLGFEQLVLVALDNYEASIQQSQTGSNIGMISASNRLETATLKALDNEVASTQQDNFGWNIGICAIYWWLEKPALKALDNPKASVQLNKDGRNMGMVAVLKGMDKVAYKALQNPNARRQVSNKGETIESLARKHGLNDMLKAFYAENKIVEEDFDEIEAMLAK